MNEMVMERAAENAELLRNGYEAFGRGDLAEVERMFAPDVVWHAYRLGQLGGDHTGWAEVARFFQGTMELSNGTFGMDLLEILANDDSAAAVVRSHAEREGRTLDSRQIHQFRVVDGRVTEVWQFVDDGEAVGAFWA